MASGAPPGDSGARRARPVHGPMLLVAAVAAIVALTAVTFWPALHAQFIGDDWGYLALSRHIDSPLSFYTYDHSSSYFYRPNAMVLWWLSVAAFGLNATAHYALGLALHAIDALLVAGIVLVASGRRGIACVAGVVFGVHPVGIGASLWLADRFDLLATLGVLGALLALEFTLRSGKHRGWLFVLALLAAGAKETAVVLPLAVAARLLVETGRPWRWRIGTLAGVGLPFLVFLAVRARLISDVSVTLDEGNLLTAAGIGIRAWFARAPEAFVGTGTPALDLPILTALVVAAAWLIARRAREGGPPVDIRAANAPDTRATDNSLPHENRKGGAEAGASGTVDLAGYDARQGSTSPSAALAIIGAACLIGPALVQWPVTKAVLISSDALANPANLRFFYLALAGVVLIGAAAISGLTDRRVRALAAVAALLACAAWMPVAQSAARHWVDISSGPAHTVAVAAGRLAESVSVVPGCRLHLLPRGLPEDFIRFADAAMKAHVARDAPLMHCAVLGDRSPWYTITRETPCRDDGWRPLEPRVKLGQPVAPRQVGDLCYHFFVDPPSPVAWNDPQSRWFVFSSGEFVEAPAR